MWRCCHWCTVLTVWLVVLTLIGQGMSDISHSEMLGEVCERLCGYQGNRTLSEKTACVKQAMKSCETWTAPTTEAMCVTISCPNLNSLIQWCCTIFTVCCILNQKNFYLKVFFVRLHFERDFTYYLSLNLCSSLSFLLIHIFRYKIYSGSSSCSTWIWWLVKGGMGIHHQ